MSAETGAFRRAGFPRRRIRITSGADASYSGSRDDPARAGEGFLLEFGGGHPPVMSVSWYTDAPGGSGRPVWRVGQGPVTFQNATRVMYATSGGRFASPDNPTTVGRKRGGTTHLGFASGWQGRVFYIPDAPAWPTGSCLIGRLTAPLQGVERACTEYSLTPGISSDPKGPSFGLAAGVRIAAPGRGCSAGWR